MIEAKNVSKTYFNSNNACEALKGVSFNVVHGEFISIMGSSGGGKSTLINCLSTVDDCTNGEIIFNGKNLTKLNKDELADFRAFNISFIFQNYNLLNTLNVFENIILPLQVKNIKLNTKKEYINTIVKKLGISDLLKKFPYQLSGGQQQRVAIARAIISETEVLFADEPTGALDRENSKILMNLFIELKKNYDKTIIMVTHDAEIAAYSSKVLFMVDGKIVSIIDKRDNESDSDFLRRIEILQNQYRED